MATAIGDYTRESTLSENDCFEVWRARDSSGREVVLTQLRAEQRGYEELCDALGEDVPLGFLIQHPNVVRLLEHGRDFFVHEYVDGWDLAQLAPPLVRLPVAMAVSIIREVSIGLQHVHTLSDRFGRPLSIVHRGLDLGNVRVGRDGTVKIAGFFERLLRNLATAEEARPPPFPAYMAPEQVRGLRLDARTDQFAVGGILYRLLTGNDPFGAKKGIELLRAMLEDDVSPPSNAVDLSPALEAVVMRALARSVGDRFVDLAAMSSALSGAVTEACPPLVDFLPAHDL